MLELPQFTYLGTGVVEKVGQGQVGIPVGTLPSLVAAGHHRCAGRGLAGAGRGSGARGRRAGRGPGSQRAGRGRGAPDTTPPLSSHISPNHSKPETSDSQMKMLQNCFEAVNHNCRVIVCQCSSICNNCLSHLSKLITKQSNQLNFSLNDF